MPEVAHTPDCQCAACQLARPATYKQPPARDWESDAKEAGKLHTEAQRNLWRTAFLIARTVKTQKSVGGRPRKTADGSAVSDDGRVTFREFARVSGLSDKTVAKYYAAWQQAAVKGWVPSADQLTANRKVKAIANLTEDQWDEVKPRTVKPKPNNGAGSNRAPVTAKDRTVAVDRSSGTTTTVSRTPETADSNPTLSGTVLPMGEIGDAPMLAKAKAATKAAKSVTSALRAGYPIEGVTIEAMANMFEAFNECKNLATAMIKAKP